MGQAIDAGKQLNEFFQALFGITGAKEDVNKIIDKGTGFISDETKKIELVAQDAVRTAATTIDNIRADGFYTIRAPQGSWQVSKVSKTDCDSVRPIATR